MMISLVVNNDILMAYGEDRLSIFPLSEELIVSTEDSVEYAQYVLLDFSDPLASRQQN